MSQSRSARRLSNWIFSGLFIVALWAPLLDNALHMDPIPAPFEKRLLSPMPEAPKDMKGLKKYPEAFDAFYRDHLGFRNSLLAAHGVLQFHGVVTSNHHRVLIGKSGWLFYTDNKCLESYLATKPFTEMDLRHWKAVLEEQRDWCRERGIRFYFMVAPDKHTIYPDRMPSAVGPAGSRRRIDQLTEYLRLNSDVELVDVRDALRKGRAQQDVYYRTDTHWNDEGALIACQEIGKTLARSFPSVTPFERRDFIWKTGIEKGGDLAEMLGAASLIAETCPVAQPIHTFPQMREVEGVPDLKVPGRKWLVAIETDRRDQPRAVVFRDSFFKQLIPFFAPHFKRSLYVWQLFCDRQIIEREKPDIVIWERVERDLYVLPEEPSLFRRRRAALLADDEQIRQIAR